MDIILTNAASQPIYDQIVSQVKAQILSGKLKEGDALPSLWRARIPSSSARSTCGVWRTICARRYPSRTCVVWIWTASPAF